MPAKDRLYCTETVRFGAAGHYRDASGSHEGHGESIAKI